MKFSAEKLDDIFASCAGAYSLQTVRGYSADLQVFIGWIRVRNRCWLPANPEAIAAFVDDQVEKHCLSTVKRRLCAIAFAHRMRDLPVPTETKVVRMAVRRAARRKPSRPKQVRGLTNAIRAKIVADCPATLAGLRDAALISVGYDTLCRSSELAAMMTEHLSFDRDGTAAVTIPRSKSDVTGNGRVAYLSPETTSLLTRWLAEANLDAGPLFRGLHLNRPSDGPLATSEGFKRWLHSTGALDLTVLVLLDIVAPSGYLHRDALRGN